MGTWFIHIKVSDTVRYDTLPIWKYSGIIHNGDTLKGYRISFGAISKNKKNCWCPSYFYV